MIFPPLASIEVDPFNIKVGRECVEGKIILGNDDLNRCFFGCGPMATRMKEEWDTHCPRLVCGPFEDEFVSLYLFILFL